MGEGIERGIDVLSQTSPEHSPALRLRAVVADELAGPFVFPMSQMTERPHFRRNCMLAISRSKHGIGMAWRTLLCCSM